MKIVFLIFWISFLGNQQEMDTLRNLYKSASESKENAEKFEQYVSQLQDNSPTIQAYQAAAIALKAKYAPKLKDKKGWFVEGATLLEKLIEENPQNVEMRLIRLSIQQNTPKILKYQENIDQDKQFILIHFSSQTQDLQLYIQEYALKSNGFSEAEKRKLGI